jgi:serpin B
MKPANLRISSAILGVVICACQSSTPYTGDLVISEKTRNLTPAVAPADLTAQVVSSNSFTLAIYGQLVAANAGQNLFFSPYSISSALAMAWAGARGTTETEMATALGFVLDQGKLHPVFNYLDLEMAKRGEGAAGKDGKGFRLKVANALWNQRDFSLLPTFLDLLAEQYGAGMHLLDFAEDPAGAAKAINAWIEEKTEGLIEKLVDASLFDAATRLVLTNAIYFNAAWASKFEKESTSTRPFKLLSGSVVPVPQMSQNGAFKVKKTAQLQAIELPYDGQEISMVILCPAEGSFDSFESALTGSKLQEILSSLESGSVHLVMPKWRFESPILSLVEQLKNLGMKSAFTSADFSGITDQAALVIQDVLHKAVVIVDEEGTEAAAATAVIFRESAAPVSETEIVLDRPLLYFIRDVPTGTILFAGRLLDPR